MPHKRDNLHRKLNYKVKGKLDTTTRVAIQSRFFYTVRETIGIVAVLTRGNKWKCFIGTCPGHDEKFDINYIADLGARVPKDIAVATFPMIKKEYKY